MRVSKEIFGNLKGAASAVHTCLCKEAKTSALMSATKMNILNLTDAFKVTGTKCYMQLCFNHCETYSSVLHISF